LRESTTDREGDEDGERGGEGIAPSNDVPEACEENRTPEVGEGVC